MRAVLSRIREELGEDAVILHTRTYYRREGWRFWRKKEIVEITASPDVKVVEEKLPTTNKKVLQAYNNSGGFYKKKRETVASIQIPQDILSLQRELKEIKKMTWQILRQSRLNTRFPGELQKVYDVLLEQEVGADIAEAIVNEISKDIDKNSYVDVYKAVLSHMSSIFGRVAPIKLDLSKRPYKVALIGPTGVGKTTTIAKLAARFSLLDMKKVGLLTVDTFRIAAVDQLRTYAEIMRLPIEVVVSPQDVPSALNRLKDRDLIFIDTAGRSQRNEIQMSELRAFLSVLKPDEVHLVLSATVNKQNLKEVLQRFSEIEVDKILFTKLDESLALGIMVNALFWTDKPLSYLTVGQSVPDDIEEPQAHKLAEKICEGLRYVGSSAETT